MTCHRLDDDGPVTEPGGELDRHIEQCPDCSARARGYERIASWIAEGKTSQRAPADWQRRTLARLRASPSPARPSESVSSGRPSAAMPGRSTGEVVVIAPPRRRRWLLATLPIASAAAIAVIVVTATSPADDRAEVIGLRGAAPGLPASRPRDIVAPPAPATSEPATAPDRALPEVPQGTAPTAPTEIKPRQVPRRPPEQAPGSGARRGAHVIVDWDEAPASPGAAPGFITIESDPANVDIYIDGKRYGQTPLIRLALPPGRHVVRAVLGSGGSRSEPIVIESGKASVFRMEMPRP